MKFSHKFYHTHRYQITHLPFGRTETETRSYCPECDARISELGADVRSNAQARKPCPERWSRPLNYPDN